MVEVAEVVVFASPSRLGREQSQPEQGWNHQDRPREAQGRARVGRQRRQRRGQPGGGVDGQQRGVWCEGDQG
ncbi:MAG: hypothetical protein AB7I30_07670 [Isosphaeraceae bacterium]